MKSISYFNLLLIFWSFKNLTIWLVYSMPRFAWPYLVEISESICCFYGYQQHKFNLKPFLFFLEILLTCLLLTSTLTMPCHTTVTWHMHKRISGYYGFPSTSKKLVLHIHGSCDKKSKKLQEFSNDIIQNSLFCGLLCLNMSKHEFRVKTEFCWFVNIKII